MKKTIVGLFMLLLMPTLIWCQAVLVVKDNFTPAGVPLDDIGPSLTRLGYPNVTIWAVADSALNAKPTDATLTSYDVVIWEQSDFNKSNIIDTDTTAIGSFLQNGGKVWLLAQNYTSILKYFNAWPMPSWLPANGEYTSMGGEQYGIDTLKGVISAHIADGFNYVMIQPWTLYWDYPDTIFSTNATATVNFLHNKGGNSGLWDTAYANGGQLFFLSSAFEAIASAADRDTLMKKTMQWFGYSVRYRDLAILDIDQPTEKFVAAVTESMAVKASFQSNSEDTLYDVPVVVLLDSMNGTNIYADTTYIDTIAPVQTVDITFPNFMIDNADTFYIKVKAALSGDFNPDNDSLKVRIIAVPGLIFFDDFEHGLGKWQGDWGITAEYNHSDGHSFTDTPYRNYYVNSDFMSWTGQTFDLTQYASAGLSFYHRYEIENGYDFGYLMLSDDGGATWDSAEAYTGFQNSWLPVSYDLAAHLSSTNFCFGFRLGSDPLRVYKGWFIDDLLLTAFSTKAQLGTTGSPVTKDVKAYLSLLGPNPCRDECRFTYQVTSHNTPVSIKVYNLSGQLVRSLDQGFKSPGYYTLKWDAKDQASYKVASGVYFVRLTIGGQSSTKQISVLR